MLVIVLSRDSDSVLSRYLRLLVQNFPQSLHDLRIDLAVPEQQRDLTVGDVFDLDSRLQRTTFRPSCDLIRR